MYILYMLILVIYSYYDFMSMSIKLAATNQ